VLTINITFVIYLILLIASDIVAARANAIANGHAEKKHNAYTKRADIHRLTRHIFICALKKTTRRATMISS